MHPRTTTPKIPFTQLKFNEMQQRKIFLLQQEKEVIIRLKDAREQGDLSENGAYKYAKFELGNIRRELRKLNHLLETGEVRAPLKATGVVGFGSMVTVINESVEYQFMLVSKHESNPAEKKLSTDSPLGFAVSGKRVGDTLTIATPKGDKVYRISEVS